VVLVLVALAACSRHKVASEVESSYRRGEYSVAVKLAERYLARGGRSDPRLLLYYGLALAAEGREEQGREKIERALAAEATLRKEATRELVALARKDIARGAKEEAGTKLELAVDIDPALDLGSLFYPLAEGLYGAQRYEEATRFFRRALRADRDTSAAAGAYIQLADAYEKTGREREALETLQHFLEAYPKARNREIVAWQVANMLYRMAKAELERGNYREARERASGIPQLTDNLLLLQRTYLLMGEAEELEGSYSAALAYFEKVVEIDDGSGGSVVERAREKIRQYRRAGLK